MYLWIVILTTVILPIGSAAVDLWFYFGSMQAEAPWVYEDFWAFVLMALVKWFVIWAGGVRLLLAGVRHVWQPGFTLKEVFGFEHKPSEAVVQELGFANIAIGSLCVMSLVAGQLTMAGAVAAGLFHGFAGLKHFTSKDRNSNRTLAMATDLLVFAVLAAGVIYWIATEIV